MHRQRNFLPVHGLFGACFDSNSKYKNILVCIPKWILWQKSSVFLSVNLPGSGLNAYAIQNSLQPAPHLPLMVYIPKVLPKQAPLLFRPVFLRVDVPKHARRYFVWSFPKRISDAWGESAEWHSTLSSRYHSHIPQHLPDEAEYGYAIE